MKKLINSLGLIIVVILFFTATAVGEITSWVDENGVKHFSNASGPPPDENVNYDLKEEVKFNWIEDYESRLKALEVESYIQEQQYNDRAYRREIDSQVDAMRWDSKMDDLRIQNKKDREHRAFWRNREIRHRNRVSDMQFNQIMRSLHKKKR